MSFKGILGRFLPFAGAFILGIFAASFFVSLSMPSFHDVIHGSSSPAPRFGSMGVEMERLRTENEILKQELGFHGINADEIGIADDSENDVAPPPPPAPRLVRTR